MILSSIRFIPRRHVSNRIKVLLFFLSIFLLVPILQTHAYADWLKCYVELDDDEEIIMHKPIVFTKDQSEEQRQVKIEIQPVYMGTYMGKAPWLTSASLDDFMAASMLKVRLQAPPSLREQRSFQFVVEATGDGVKFVGPGVMCDGRRAFSKQHQTHVLLQLAKATQNIELVAGWAAGYEAVKLTSKMILKTSSSSDDETITPQTEGSDEL